MQQRKQAVTLGQLRDKLCEVLIAGEDPVMVTRDGIPLGFFLPAKLWVARHDSDLAKYLVELVIASAGQSIEDIRQVINEADPRRGRHLQPRRAVEFLLEPDAHPQSRSRAHRR